ncbi:MAG: hypothetical protein A2Z72_06730 [Omnitrophica bacterium RBG_13_46_9]|nr:MAG: hypothetical protein A2Z72_06730 [Omnitrophica bacterium RBG_13_46_9]
MVYFGKVPCYGKVRPYRCAPCYLHRRGLPMLVGITATALSPVLKRLFRRMDNRLGTVFGIRDFIVVRIRNFEKLCNISDRIVAVSQWLYDVLRQNGVPANKIYLSRHGLNLDRFVRPETMPEKEASGALKVGYIGRLNLMKGIGVLIEAVKRLPRTVPVELRLYGRINDQDDRACFQKLQKITDKDDRIVFGEEITDENRQAIFSELDAIAVPSLWLEAGPFVVLEAFAFGIPVIGSRLGGIAELVTHGVNGLLVEAGNIGAWAEAIKKVSLNRKLLKDLAGGIQPVRTTREVADDMVSVYRDILGLI